MVKYGAENCPVKPAELPFIIKSGEVSLWSFVATNDQSDTSPDLIINGSSAGLTGQFSAPYLTTHKDQVFYDLNYSLEVTPFCDWAKAISPNVYDGIGMLVNQAAYSFNNWFGVKPNTEKVLSDLKSL